MVLFLNTHFLLSYDLKNKVISLSKKTLYEYVKTGYEIRVSYEEIPKPLQEKKGVFVTIGKGSNTRGCVGTIFPQEVNLCNEIIKNTIKAAKSNIKPITADELDSLKVTITIIEDILSIKNIYNIDSTKDGIYVKSGNKEAVILPWEAKTSLGQLKMALKKAKIGRRETFSLFKIKASRFKER